MNFLRTLLPLLALAACIGCAGPTPLGRSGSPQRYSRVTVTNPRGLLVAEWIAEGPVKARGEGYRFRTVQRVSAPPFSVVSRYPLGRVVWITGPNITVAPSGKPVWLYDLDGF